MFTELHDQIREQVRLFVEKEISPYADQWEEEDLPGP